MSTSAPGNSDKHFSQFSDILATNQLVAVLDTWKDSHLLYCPHGEI